MMLEVSGLRAFYGQSQALHGLDFALVEGSIVTLLGANVLAHGVKGAKGDVRSSNLFLSHVRNSGVLDQNDNEATDTIKQDDLSAKAVMVAPPQKPRPSEWLFENLDPDLLSRDEKIELSRLAEIIDLGGDVTALSTTDFERIKSILNKGRGKDITPPGDVPAN